LQARKDYVIGRLFRGLNGLLEARQIHVVKGRGVLIDGRTVAVHNDGECQTITGDAVVIATGSTPVWPSYLEPDGTRIVTSDQFFDLDVIPRNVAVIGAGATGCEFASALADFGASVTLVERATQLLPIVDREITDLLAQRLSRRGIALRLSTAVRHTGSTSGHLIELQMDGPDTLSVDLVVVSVGRRPLTDHLGLENTRACTDESGYIQVDESGCTADPTVFAVGDVVPTPQLAHVAFAEAITAIKAITGVSAANLPPEQIPLCIYTHPEVGVVGLTEDQARHRFERVSIVRKSYAGNSRAAMLGETDGLMKLVLGSNSDEATQIVGVHMVGPWATEHVGQAMLAVSSGKDIDELARHVWPHPTLSETFGEAVLAATGRPLH